MPILSRRELGNHWLELECVFSTYMTALEKKVWGNLSSSHRGQESLCRRIHSIAMFGAERS